MTISHDNDAQLRKAYEQGGLYDVRRICLRPTSDPQDYVGRLLVDRLALVRKFYAGGAVLDLCCATGEHLFSLSPLIDTGIGLDFSRRYVETAKVNVADRGIDNLSFVQANARTMPFRSGSFALVYSFSSLYAIDKVEEIVADIARVLRPGGVAVLDFGNRRSINCYCLRYYTDWPPVHPITPGEMNSYLGKFDLSIIERHCYQVLPLWADKPRWLTPLLHPIWKRFMSPRLNGRMIDEWISGLPGIRQFAFRHVIVCRKS